MFEVKTFRRGLFKGFGQKTNQSNSKTHDVIAFIERRANDACSGVRCLSQKFVEENIASCLRDVFSIEYMLREYRT